MFGFFGYYRNHRSEPYFTYLKNGKKNIEGRLNKGRYKYLKVSSSIKVYNNNETEFVKVVVLRTTKYLSFFEMLSNEKIERLLPNVKSVKEGVAIYRKFYTKKQEYKFGVVAIEVRLINE